MRFTRVAAFLAILFGIAMPAHAQPSYNCGGRLNPTEQTICNNADLSALDRTMAAKHDAILVRFSDSQRSAFRSEQLQWLRDRDACGRAVGCIRANYVYRINQFDGITGGGTPPGAASVARLPSAKVLSDGTIERRTADGILIRRLPSGETERFAPDGTKLSAGERLASSNVQPASLPPLPPPLERWGTTLETSLLDILRNLLTDEEYSAYRSTESGKNDYKLIDWRLRSIAFLTQP